MSSGPMRVPPHPYYAICLDSMSKLDPAEDKFQVILIDECEQVLRHLVGSTLRRVRRAVFKRLEHYLRVADLVILLDADLGMVTKELLEVIHWKAGAKIHIVLNGPKP